MIKCTQGNTAATHTSRGFARTWRALTDSLRSSNTKEVRRWTDCKKFILNELSGIFQLSFTMGSIGASGHLIWKCSLWICVPS